MFWPGERRRPPPAKSGPRARRGQGLAVILRLLAITAGATVDQGFHNVGLAPARIAPLGPGEREQSDPVALLQSLDGPGPHPALLRR